MSSSGNGSPLPGTRVLQALTLFLKGELLWSNHYSKASLIPSHWKVPFNKGETQTETIRRSQFLFFFFFPRLPIFPLKQAVFFSFFILSMLTAGLISVCANRIFLFLYFSFLFFFCQVFVSYSWEIVQNIDFKNLSNIYFLMTILVIFFSCADDCFGPRIHLFLLKYILKTFFDKVFLVND